MNRLRRYVGGVLLAGFRAVEETEVVEPSEEIRRAIERWASAVGAADVETVLARLSEHRATLLIGTDPSEWWQGRAVRAVFARQMHESGAYPISVEELDAWEEGNVGWAVGRFSVEWAGKPLQARASFVLRLERGEWKIVHQHMSLPQTNEAVGIKDMTTTLQELEEKLGRDQPDLSSSLAIDGTVTIVFTDIVDSTIMLSRLGDHAWLGVIRRHNAVIEELAVVHGGTVVETQGDGSMLAFSSARRAVAFARALQRAIEREFADFTPPIRIRIGMHTGDALQDADHFFGSSVHYAARVASNALGGEVLVSSVVRDLVDASSSEIQFLECREVQLKGLEGLHRLYALASN